MLSSFRKKIKCFAPVKYKPFYGKFRDKKFTMLDVGCGNHSATHAKQWFSQCIYHGIDNTESNFNSSDLEALDTFHPIDLSTEKITTIPDNFFHVIIVSHVIEHLPNGISLIDDLSAKLISGGVIYIEFPAVKTLAFPSAKRGTLHFCDDESHRRLYDLKEIANVLLANNFKIHKAGTRHDPCGILFLPLILLIKLLKRESLTGYGLWDLFGFAQYVYAEKR